jgi:polysaccharide deacetylase 2 family uncharacterized protein YibQ
MKRHLVRIVIILGISILLAYALRGLWIKGIILEKHARLLSEYLDQSFSRLGLKASHISRHFYEERRCGLKKFVHTTKILNLPDKVSQELFYQAVFDAAKASNAKVLEKTSFEIDSGSISIFMLGHRTISTHLIVGVKKKVLKDKVAIIIDDLGYNKKVLDFVKEIDVPLTLAVLPRLPFSKEIAKLGHSLGHEIILHLPLEPEEDLECLGPGAILLKMTPQEIRDTLDEGLRTVPYCQGLNNHAGSKFTSDAGKMKIFLEIVKERNLFFIDSLVVPASTGAKLSKELGILFAERDIFLDNIKEEGYVSNQLSALIDIAHKNCKAIGIGHPTSVTFKVLKERIPMLDSVEFVHVSKLLRK